ncbi:MAG TPA: hypothetical protein VJU15_12930 [Gemmatimonadales bacterium]|nr:hypothetical protein [Gemmatimonadales bacterium]
MQRVLAGNFHLIAILIVLLLLAGMFLLVEVGYRIGLRHRREDDSAGEGLGALEGGVLGLMSLLLAFSFSGAADRFNTRRALVVEEANELGTAWLRLELLPPAAQPAIRDSFRNYVDSRIETYRAMPDYDKAMASLARANALQPVIWKMAVDATRDGWAPAATVLFPSLNSTFDIATTRFWATRMHPPFIIHGLLLLLVLLGASLAGYAMSRGGRRRWSHTLIFVCMVVITIWIILDLEYPRLGLVRVDEFDQAIADVRATMN